jgi:hypothetical protein
MYAVATATSCFPRKNGWFGGKLALGGPCVLLIGSIWGEVASIMDGNELRPIAETAVVNTIDEAIFGQVCHSGTSVPLNRTLIGLVFGWEAGA